MILQLFYIIKIIIIIMIMIILQHRSANITIFGSVLVRAHDARRWKIHSVVQREKEIMGYTGIIKAYTNAVREKEKERERKRWQFSWIDKTARYINNRARVYRKRKRKGTREEQEEKRGRRLYPRAFHGKGDEVEGRKIVPERRGSVTTLKP